MSFDLERATKLSLLFMTVLSAVGCTSLAQDTTNAATQTPVYVIVNSETEAPSGTRLPGSATEISAVFPTPYICQAEIVEQPYEHGRMFWVGGTMDERCQEQHTFTPGSGAIWVLIFDASGEGGTWLSFVDDWNSESEVPFDLTMTQPADLLQPVRGFGKVWREKLTDEQRNGIGWATQPEIKFVTTYRYDAGGFVDDHGTYVPRPGQHTLISYGGETFFLDEQSATFDVIPAD